MTEESATTKQEAYILVKSHIDIMKKNILRLLSENGMTRVDLANKIGKDKYYVNYILNHAAPRPQIDNIIKIAWALNVELVELFQK